MLSTARSLSRTLPRAATVSSRAFLTRRTVPVLRTGLGYSSITSNSSPAATAPRLFSTSALFRASSNAKPSTEVDTELSAKLASEIAFEEEIGGKEQLPASIDDFLSNTDFVLHDQPGQDEVKLTRTFGDEKITVTFSTGDMNQLDPDMYNEDPALGDEDDLDDPALEAGESERSSISAPASAKSPSSSSSSKTPAQKTSKETTLVEDLDDDDLALDDDETDDEYGQPIRINVVVEKPSRASGAVAIDASIQSGALVVDGIAFFEDVALAHDNTPAAAIARSTAYTGPPFGSLDEDLQVLVERYLEERGVTLSLAAFIPDYVDVKEEREYLQWLGRLKKFIDA